MIDTILNKERYFDLIQYFPESAQKEIHDSTARFRVNIQGRRSGKSYSAAREIEPYILTPNTRGCVVAPTYDLASRIGNEISQKLLFELQIETTVRRETGGNLFYLKTPLNSEFWIKSADNPTSCLGLGFDYIVIDEAAQIPQRIWEQYLRPTLSDRQGWALFCTTPRGFNWVYDLYARGQSDDYPEWESWIHPSSSSRYFRDDIDEIKRTLTKETFQQEYLAMFTSFAGTVFQFSRDTHIKKLQYNPSWETYCTIDFGYRMPAVLWVQVGMVNGEEHIHIIDEIVHETDIKSEILARRILNRRYPIMNYFCDPAGGGVQSTSGVGDIEIFRRHGINPRFKTDKVSRTVPAGIELVRSYVENARGKARLFVSDKCKGVIEDFETYRYPERKQDSRLKDEPLKDGRSDHSMDALRYFFTNRFPIIKRELRQVAW